MRLASPRFLGALAVGAGLVSAKQPTTLFEGISDVSITRGPVIYAGTSTQEIVHFTTTSYPGAIPANQKGGLFLWPGLSNDGSSDLIQSVMGSYPPGESECSGTNRDTEWYKQLSYCFQQHSHIIGHC